MGNLEAHGTFQLVGHLNGYKGTYVAYDKHS